WTPIFFLDDAVALAAGHRPCGLCRRHDYLSYREAVRHGRGIDAPVFATDLNRMLAGERLRRGSGLSRAADRKTWLADIGSLPNGTVIIGDDRPRLVLGAQLLEFRFTGWTRPVPRRASGAVRVLTPPTSVIALANGYRPAIHPSAEDTDARPADDNRPRHPRRPQ
ncbi:MAG: hypothetical protein ACRDU9_02995, partial [Acidimicrobiia bacterium]